MIRSKLFSFTNSSRRKAAQDFLWEDFKTIKWIIEHHYLFFIKNIIPPVLIIIFLSLVFYFINIKFDLNKLDKKETYDIVKYMKLFWIIVFTYIIFLAIKKIYNIFVDYRNDFIIFFKNWVYISDKDWVFYHSQVKILYDSINTIKATEHGLISSLFWYWTVLMTTTWDLWDIVFHSCKNMKKEIKKLRDLHSEYLAKNDIRWVLSNNLINKNHAQKK